MNHMTHEEWLRDLTNGATTRSIGKAIGVSHTTISRQLGNGKLSAEIVIDLCRAYEKLPADGLIETGYLKPWEVDGAGKAFKADQLTNMELLDAIIRRSDPEARKLFGGEGQDDVIGIDADAPGAEVFEFPTPDVEHERYVAKTKKPEPREGDDDYGPGA